MVIERFCPSLWIAIYSFLFQITPCNAVRIPRNGLHPLDVRTLLGVFQTLIGHGATVVVIEHDLDVIRNADYLMRRL